MCALLYSVLFTALHLMFLCPSSSQELESKVKSKTCFCFRETTLRILRSCDVHLLELLNFWITCFWEIGELE